MKFPNQYKVLSQRSFMQDEYSIVPIRYEDRIKIMQWRNEQINILRQSKPLTELEQNSYFDNVVHKLFEQEQPNQILFSFLEGNKCIGYGGLVHVDWQNENAEISFLLETKLSKENTYIELFGTFLNLIEQVGTNIALHKIYTYGYDLESFRFIPVIAKKYSLEAILKEHVFVDSTYVDVKIYSKFL